VCVWLGNAEAKSLELAEGSLWFSPSVWHHLCKVVITFFFSCCCRLYVKCIFKCQVEISWGNWCIYCFLLDCKCNIYKM